MIRISFVTLNIYNDSVIRTGRSVGKSTSWANGPGPGGAWTPSGKRIPDEYYSAYLDSFYDEVAARRRWFRQDRAAAVQS